MATQSNATSKEKKAEFQPFNGCVLNPTVIIPRIHQWNVQRLSRRRRGHQVLEEDVFYISTGDVLPASAGERIGIY